MRFCAVVVKIYFRDLYTHREFCREPHTVCRTMVTEVMASGTGSLDSSVCALWSHFVLLCLVALQARFFNSGIVSPSLCPPSPLLRATLITPLSFAEEAMEGFSIAPVSSWVFSMFVVAISRTSPCKSFKGRSKARQQVKDHCGFWRHSLMYW